MNNELFLELQSKQHKLDTFIYETKKIEQPESLLPETVIALQVEWNEFINELPRIFKYWSNKKNNLDNALVEYIDNLHFLLKLSYMLGVKDYAYQRPKKEYDLRQLVIGINNMISSVAVNKRFHELMNYFLLFGEKCNFTQEQILDAYEKKYQENIARQLNNY